MAKNRSPMQVSPEFEMKLKKLQIEIMKKQGKKVSFRELTKKIASQKDFENIEKSLLNDKRNKPEDFRIKFDIRGL